MKRAIRNGILLITALFCLTLSLGCGEELQSIGYDLPGAPHTLDPQFASDQASQIVIGNVFEGLFRLDGEGEPQNALAESYTVSPDGLTYRFALQPDAAWGAPSPESAPRPITAHDFVFAFERLFQPGAVSVGANRFLCIQNAGAVLTGNQPVSSLSVRAVEEKTLEIVLETPDSHFPRLLGSTYAMPCNEEFFKETRGRYGLDDGTLLSNGPFQVASWKAGDVIRLVKNKSYRDEKSVRPNTVRLYYGGRPAGETPLGSFERLENGTVNALLTDLGAKRLPEGDWTAQPMENAVWGILWNQNNPVLKSPAFRRSVAQAIDRTAYAEQLADGLTAAYAMLPHDVLLESGSFRAAAGESVAPPYNPAAAFEGYKAALAGLALESPGELRLLVNADSGVDSKTYFAALSQIIQRELSLFIRVEAVGGDEYASRLSSGDYELAICRFYAGDHAPWSILSSFLSDSPSNWGGYQNPEYDAALRAAEAATGMEAEKNYIRAEQILLGDSAVIPLYYASGCFVTRTDTEGIRYQTQTGLIDFRAAQVR